MSKLPTDEQMVLAIQHRKDLFTSRFVTRTSANWCSMDDWYFKHICTVLDHAKRVFEVSVDDLTTTKPTENE